MLKNIRKHLFPSNLDLDQRSYLHPDSRGDFLTFPLCLGLRLLSRPGRRHDFTHQLFDSSTNAHRNQQKICYRRDSGDGARRTLKNKRANGATDSASVPHCMPLSNVPRAGAAWRGCGMTSIQKESLLKTDKTQRASRSHIYMLHSCYI